ncbi:glutathionylspermidine synthase family protein [Photobacterium kishitanii]|uniref:Glutathionylspermidine synthase pre-ATP-grasp-like domain-containing protein n=1 Tax=Photobacterium kishitanii TaxID=318456 RepID=A0A2T3KMA6_9GAMM|nr:glutathionylspermidine synthase family protein [Photobacterium kishitanii]PSV00918.1 hypothetical protein C9J27_02505 [Photobacterium kishitanii]
MQNDKTSEPVSTYNPVSSVDSNRIVRTDIDFKLEDVANFCPLTYSTFTGIGDKELAEQINDQFFFPVTHTDSMPAYKVTKSECEHIANVSEAMYGLLVDSIGFIFSDKYKHRIKEFYGEGFLGDYPSFVDYAIYTYENNHEAVYGRFDIGFDWEKGEVTKFYEFNGDTPVMIFESVYMQNHYAEKYGDKGAQFNTYFNDLSKSTKRVLGGEDKNVAILGDLEFIEDALTVETMLNVLSDDNKNLVFADSVYNLEYDYRFIKTPFHINDVELDAVFMLYPWEEMVAGTPDIMNQWHRWCDTTRFFEPAWRWFVANKGVWAWLTEIIEKLQYEDDELKALVNKYSTALPHIPRSYRQNNGEFSDYVQKPLMGRLSSNIKIYHGGDVSYESGGGYGEDDVIYQEYCAPVGVKGRNNAILGVWMTPWSDGAAMFSEASSLAIREFDSPVLSIANERFIPHVVVEDGSI